MFCFFFFIFWYIYYYDYCSKNEIFLKNFKSIFFWLNSCTFMVNCLWKITFNLHVKKSGTNRVKKPRREKRQMKEKLNYSWVQSHQELYWSQIWPQAIQTGEPKTIETPVCCEKFLNKAYNLYNLFYCFFFLFCEVQAQYYGISQALTGAELHVQPKVCVLALLHVSTLSK
jgi:hypothetical protein